MPPIATARVIFLFVAATYLLSALLLGWARARGEAVPVFAVVGWAVTGAAGVVLALLLAERRIGVWVGLFVVLAPWMVYALVGDAGEKRWVMTAADAAGVAAIAWALWISWPHVR